VGSTREDSVIGKRGLRRKDGYEKATGTAIFPSDVELDRMLYAKFFPISIFSG
jgi:CO/xanthine dehydrogenase Mo-binding subunit